MEQIKEREMSGTSREPSAPKPGVGECAAPEGPADVMAPFWARYETDEWGSTRGSIADLQDREISTLERYIDDFLNGRMEEDHFKPMRLYMGIYGQRQGGTNQMIRIKIPFGHLTAERIETIAEATERFAPRKLAHVTTRQDLQVHFVQLRDVPALLRMLASAGVTTREACGNTVRNVTGCCRMGVCPTEPFDLTPYADIVSKFFLRNPACKNLPRKFKIAFSGCAHDCAAGAIHDIGILAQVRRDNGTERLGFKVLAGGGLGSTPRAAIVLEEFIPKELLLPTCAALVRVFNRAGNRKNRYRARMKFVVQKLGVEKFVEEVRRERESVLAEPLPALPDPEPNEPFVQGRRPAPKVRPADVSDAAWFDKNCDVQRQSGLYVVNVYLYRGDVTVVQMRGIAALLRRHPEMEVRLSYQQNLVIRNVAEGKLGAVYDQLSAMGLALAGAETTMDVTVCPGADTCNLAKTHSMGLAEKLTARLKDNPDVNGYRIKISGCENACGQHQIADLGFHGCIRKVGGRIVPHYVLMLGGGVDEHGARFGREIVKVPARRIEAVVSRLVTLYKKERENGESFGRFLQRVDKQRAKESIQDLIPLPSFEEDRDAYRDVGEEKDYQFLEKEGECAA